MLYALGDGGPMARHGNHAHMGDGGPKGSLHKLSQYNVTPGYSSDDASLPLHNSRGAGGLATPSHVL